MSVETADHVCVQLGLYYKQRAVVWTCEFRMIEEPNSLRYSSIFVSQQTAASSRETHRCVAERRLDDSGTVRRVGYSVNGTDYDS